MSDSLIKNKIGYDIHIIKIANELTLESLNSFSNCNFSNNILNASKVYKGASIVNIASS